MSAEALTTMTNKDIIVNVIVQFINLWIFLFIFYKLFAKNIVDWLNEREKLIDKLKNADQEYENIIWNAHSEANKIIEDSVLHKNKIINEWKTIAQQQSHQILQTAEKKSKEIIDNAQSDIDKIKKDLKDNWENWVKSTVKVVVNKLFDQDVELKSKYFDKVIEEFKN